MRILIISIIVAAGCIAQPRNNSTVKAPKVDFSASTTTKPIKVGSTNPAACAAGELFVNTSSPSGQRLKLCESTNTWVTQGDGNSGGGGASSNITVLGAGLLANGFGQGETVIDVLWLGLAAKYTNGSAQHSTWWTPIPTNWTGVAPSLRLFWVNGASSSSNTYKWNVLTSCDASGAGAWNTADVLTVNDTTTALESKITTSTLTITGCTAGVEMRIRVQEGTSYTSSATHYLSGIEVVWPLS